MTTPSYDLERNEMRQRCSSCADEHVAIEVDKDGLCARCRGSIGGLSREFGLHVRCPTCRVRAWRRCLVLGGRGRVRDKCHDKRTKLAMDVARLTTQGEP